MNFTDFTDFTPSKMGKISTVLTNTDVDLTKNTEALGCFRQKGNKCGMTSYEINKNIYENMRNHCSDFLLALWFY